MGCGLLVLILGVVSFVGIRNWWEGSVSKTITSPAKSGKPIVSPSQDGWISATFPEVPLTVQLPGTPVVEPFEQDALDDFTKIETDQYVNYVADYENGMVDLEFYWLTTIGMLMIADPPQDVKDYLDMYVENWAEGKPEVLRLPKSPRNSAALKVAYKDFAEDETGKIEYACYLAVPFPKGIAIIAVIPGSGDDGVETLKKIAASLELR